MTLSITGYLGYVWNAVLNTLTYYNNNVSTTSSPNALTLTQTTSASLKNAIDLFNANTDVNQVYNIYIQASEALAVPITVDPTTASYLENRLTGLLAFSSNLTRFNLPLPNTNGALASNQVSIPYSGYLEYVLGFTGEPAPAGLTTANFIEMATAAANAWGTYAETLTTSGRNYTGTEYQICLDLQTASLAVVQYLNDANFQPNYNLTTLWNLLVAVPTYLTLSSFMSNNPTSTVSQNTNAAKYVMYTLLNQMNQTLLVLGQQVNGNILMTTVQQGENLMDIAARTSGNFETWQQLAAFNNLLPPYISTQGLPNTVAPGQRIFLPTNGNVQTATGPGPSYLTNYLGVDVYYGPIGQDMLPWIGDFNLISGYNNLSLSLGRRLQTELGSLIYHVDFGSRLPPLVGSVMSESELQVAQQYAISSLMSDPRVNSATTTGAAYSNYSIAVTATVIPNGFTSTGVTVNEVIL